jgi:crotonobetainyl-CoA:carnitine CoA-transferase CaiB-like acyl-CoA transferase
METIKIILLTNVLLKYHFSRIKGFNYHFMFYFKIERMPIDMAEGPLAQLRVIDLGQYIAGSYCSKLMAGFGAEVIKIEPPGRGDEMRRMGPFFQNKPGLEGSIPFLWLNTGKESVTLDLETEEDLETLRTLIRDADVVLENCPPGIMSGLGLGYEDLQKINPRIVLTSITSFGQSGPYKDYQAEDIVLYALSGGMYLTGDPERPPLTAGPAVCQYTAGLCAYIATLMALFQRHITGEGQHVDISIQEAALSNIEMALKDYLQLGNIKKRNNDKHPIVPWELYPCADGEVAIIGGPVRHWVRGAKIIFDESKLIDKKFLHAGGRIQNRKEFEEILLSYLKKHKKRDLFIQGQEHNLAFGYLKTINEVLESPQHKIREFFVEIDHPVIGKHKYCGAPFILSKTPWHSSRAPLLGEHSKRILSELRAPSQQCVKHEKSGEYKTVASWSSCKSMVSDSAFTFPKNTEPLKGIRVLDFTKEWAGPLATRILADFGAEVIRVEYARRMCPLRGGILKDQKYNRHPCWHQVNRNKLSITLDLNLPEDRKIAKDLVSKSDLVVSNSRTGVMEKFGLSYEDLIKINPNVIAINMAAFGATGPYSSYSGYGANFDALTGLQGLTAYSKEGKKYRIKEVDVVNGLTGLCAIMTAFLHRQRTGEGQWIDLSQTAGAIHVLMGEHLLEYVMNGTQTLPLGNRHRWFAPQGCYRCQGEDKWVVLTIRSEEEWQRLCELLGHPEWQKDQRFATRAARRENHDELDRLIEEWTRQYSHYEVMHLLQDHGLVAGAVLTVAELSEDPHLKKRGYFMRSKDGNKGLFPGMPFRLSKGSGNIRWRGPDLGQHNEYVLTELLSFSKDQVRPINENDIGTAYE